MAEAVRVGEVVAAWFARGDLPECVAALPGPGLPAGLAPGALLVWSEQAGAYRPDRGRRRGYLLAGAVRQGWGRQFGQVPAMSAPSVEQACLDFAGVASRG